MSSDTSPSLFPEILISDSATRLTLQDAGAVAYCASHGGAYCALLARAAGLRAIILNDAGVGIGQAGIGALDVLDADNVPAAMLGHMSACIGLGADGAQHGQISYVNATAAALGVVPGMSCQEALRRLHDRAPEVAPDPSRVAQEHRTEHRLGTGDAVVIADSVSLVQPEDAGRVVVCGSHGGLLGGDPRTAVRAPVHAIVFNDADRGKDNAGLSRLPALDARGIAGACVSAWTAPIGDGMATFEQGVISALNRTAIEAGARPGMTTIEFATLMADQAERAARSR